MIFNFIKGSSCYYLVLFVCPVCWCTLKFLSPLAMSTSLLPLPFLSSPSLPISLSSSPSPPHRMDPSESMMFYSILPTDVLECRVSIYPHNCTYTLFLSLFWKPNSIDTVNMCLVGLFSLTNNSTGGGGANSMQLNVFCYLLCLRFYYQLS